MSCAVVAVFTLIAALAWHVHRVGQAAPRFPPQPLPAVVLGARVYGDGRPSNALVDRVTTGVALLKSGRASLLVLSGGTPDARPNEAAVMRALALSMGAVPEQLVLEAQSRTTAENAARCAELLEAREVLLVTCDFHVVRARAHFHTRGFVVWPVPSKRTLRPVDRWRVTLKEVAGLLRRPQLLWAFHSPRSV